MRISRRDDKISSCNHDMDSVIGDIALVFIDPYWFGESNNSVNKHKGLGNKGNILRSG